MYRQKFEEAQAEIIKLQQQIIDLTSSRQGGSFLQGGFVPGPVSERPGSILHRPGRIPWIPGRRDDGPGRNSRTRDRSFLGVPVIEQVVEYQVGCFLKWF